MAAGSRIYDIGQIVLNSAYGNAGTQTASVTVTIPDNATFGSATLILTCGNALTNNATLTAAGKAIQKNSTNIIPFSDVIPAPGTYSILFKYQVQSSGVQSVILSDITVSVEYTMPDPPGPGPGPGPTPGGDVEPAGTQESDGLITLHDGSAKDFGAGLGLCVLTPSKCTVTETAGGDYSLSLEHPLTPDRRWELIQPWTLVRVPVPMSDTPAIDASGGIVVGYEIWVVNAVKAGLYTSTNYVRYPNWVAGKSYVVGSYVRYQGYNYRCKVPNNYTTFVAGCWTKLGTGDPTSKRSLSQGTRLYVSATTSSWLTVKLATGETGYCKVSECGFVRVATDEDIAALKTSERRIRAQVFRLTEVTVTEKGVSATGLHVSYDFNMLVTSALSTEAVDLPNAVVDLRNNILVSPDPPNIYPEDTGINVTTEWSAGASPVEVLLDPDNGFVAQAKARLVRDNWDFFLLKNQGEDRGFHIVYGVNLTGVTWKRDFSSLVTRVIPVGKDENGDPLYLGGTAGALIYVQSDLWDRYPLIAYKYMGVNVQVGQEDPYGVPYTPESARAEMERQATACFIDSHEDEPTVELEVSFVQLGQSEAFRQYRQLERVSLYDWVTIEHPDLGIFTRAQVKGYEWDALRQTFNRITLGDVFHVDTSALAGWQIADGSITPRKLSEAAKAAVSAT